MATAPTVAAAFISTDVPIACEHARRSDRYRWPINDGSRPWYIASGRMRCEDVYLGRGGKWTTWERAAKFSTVEALETFAAKCGVDVFGIF